MVKKAQLDEVRPVLDAANNVIDKVDDKLDILDKVTDKGADVIEAGLEKVADVVPEALDTTVHVSTKGTRKILEALRRPKVQAITVVGLSMAVGAGLGFVGYKIMKQRLELKYQAILDEKLEEETANLRRFYAKKNKDGEFATPQAVVEKVLTADAAAALRNYAAGTVISDHQQSIEEVRGVEESKATGDSDPDIVALREKMQSGTPVTIEEDARNNIFVEGRPLTEFDYDTEVLNRNPEEPYVITHDEYMENEDDRTQTTLTYYNGDDILADEREMPIADIEEVVGSENLTKFGYGSNDRNVVYVRNEKAGLEFEIILNEGKFGEQVAGLKHSAPPLRRARWGDDE